MRIAAYSGQPVDTPTWADAAAYAKRINAVAFPHYTDADWDAFARRIFREGTEGAPVLNYDPDIAVPIKAAGAKALVPNLWPMFSRLTKGRQVLLIRGQNSDLLSETIAAKMRKRAPKMDFVEVAGRRPRPHAGRARGQGGDLPVPELKCRDVRQQVSGSRQQGLSATA